MSERRHSSFKQIDVTRALRAARVAGFEIGKVEIDATGRIVMFAASGEPDSLNALEKWKQDRARAS